MIKIGFLRKIENQRERELDVWRIRRMFDRWCSCQVNVRTCMINTRKMGGKRPHIPDMRAELDGIKLVDLGLRYAHHVRQHTWQRSQCMMNFGATNRPRDELIHQPWRGIQGPVKRCERSGDTMYSLLCPRWCYMSIYTGRNWSGELENKGETT